MIPLKINPLEDELPELLEMQKLPFTLDEHDEDMPAAGCHYDEGEEYTYKVITQSVVFKEDDRKERPFVIVQFTKH